MEESHTFRQVHKELYGLLTHLHDPDYEPSALMFRLTGVDPTSGGGPVQSAIARMIASLEPGDDVPADACPRRIHEILRHRYILKLTQEETAEQLAMSTRHVRRLQRQATHRLARVLWERGVADHLWQPANAGAPEANPPSSSSGASDEAWRTQIKEDLASLRSDTPAAVAQVEGAIQSAVKLQSLLTRRHEATLSLGPIQPGLVVTMHPAALRQVLLAAIGQLLRNAAPGRITIGAEQVDSRVEIRLDGPHAPELDLPAGAFIREVVAAQGGSFEALAGSERITLLLRLPSAGPVPVLIVDDNPGMVHFYRRCVRGTRYTVRSADGAHLLEAVAEAPPAIIILDMMLPDVDGWELLTDLHAHPLTRSIPVIVCSVVREEELALILGAKIYLRKPVRPQQFIQALDQVYHQASLEALTPQARSEGDC
jgi:CheY-like chemotaxis protein